MAQKFLNGVHISGTTQLDFMPTHESEGIIKLGRYDSNTSRYHEIKSYVSSTEASNYLKFSLHNGTANTVVDVLTLNGNKAATFAGNVNVTGAIDVTGHIQAFTRVYLRESIQVLNKASSGFVDFATRNTSGSETLMDLSNVGSATFAGTVNITSGGNIGLTINHDDFNEGLVIHRNHADNSPSITFKNNDGQHGILFSQESDNNIYWRQGTNATNYKIWHAGNDGSGSGLDADTLDGNNSSAFAPSSVVNQTDFVSKANGGTFDGNINVQDIIMGAADRFRHGSYLELSYGASNTSQLTFNADYDGSQTGTYTPHYSGTTSAGMSVIKMPSGGVGGLDFYVKKHGTTSGSHNIGTFTKILELNQNGTSTFGGNVTAGSNSLTAGSLDINGSADISGNITGVNNLYADKVYINSLQTLATSSNFLYIDPNQSFSSGIYINNAVKVDGGLLGSYNEDLQLRTGSTTRLTLSNSDGTATFGGKVSVGGGDTSTAQMALKGQQSLLSFIRGTAGDSQFFMSSDSSRLYFSHTDIQTTNLILKLDASNESATFAGNVTVNSDSNAIGLRVNGRSSDDIAEINMYENDGTTLLGRIQTRTTEMNIGSITSIPLYLKTGGTTALTLDTSQNATFAGGITVSSPGGAFYTRFKSANDYVIGLQDSNAADQWWLKAYTNGNFALHENGVGDKFTIAAGGNATFAGSVNVNTNGLINFEQNPDVDTGTEVVAQVTKATYTAAFFDFVIKKGTNVRAGVVYACHDGSTGVEYAETSTVDLGDTTDVTLSVDLGSSTMRLLATTTSNDWSVKSLIRAI